MLSSRSSGLGLLVGLALLGLSCTMLSGPAADDPDALRQKAQHLQQKLAQAPDDATLRRDLGVVYVRLNRPDSARRHLTRAHERAPDDPKTIYFLGIAHEKSGNDERALDLYAQYEDVPASSRYRKLLRGRHEWLRRKRARREIRARAQEGGDTPELSARTVAVFPLAYQGRDSTYAPLGRGLGELVLTDLSNVERLRVVERIRLQALLNELKLSQSKYVDPSTAPRVGRLVGAGRLVGGAYDVQAGDDGKKTIEVSLSVVNLTGAVQAPGADTTSGTVSELFDLQNELVFALIDRLGVELTAEERVAIEKVPTRNLEAFLAFSRGLEAEDQGRYGVASQLYRRAARLDPGFEAAAQARGRAQRLEQTGGSTSTAVAAATTPPVPSLDLQQLRHSNLAGQSPPPRQPAGEQTSASEGVLEGAPPLPTDDGSQ